MTRRGFLFGTGAAAVVVSLGPVATAAEVSDGPSPPPPTAPEDLVLIDGGCTHREGAERGGPHPFGHD